MSAVACGLLGAALLAAPSPQRRRRFRKVLGRCASSGRYRMPAWTLATLLAVGAVIVSGVILWLAGPAPVFALFAVCGVAVKRTQRRMAERAHRADIGRTAEALDAVIAELRVGAHPATACATAADQSQGTARTVFARAAARARLGAEVSAGFSDSKSESPTRQIGAAWRISESHGVRLAELLAAVKSDLKARNAFESQLHAGLSGARATATILAMLPLAGIGLGEMMGAAPIRTLLSTTIGGTLLVAGTLLAVSGLLWSDRILAGARC
ncbi:type II secretion system F family protein [Hoyosella altamirensis]|uniref:Tight adherence protein B n=1 Tax=Hoyosella altamirensis TaxID=616997 RepID=A0A839RND2_9ACTN|nr:type II secretion system F family protein [Hoyosella altamirensis]MBB3037819.1 tight adherence protein B [Hoyosella altamirensis]